MKNKIFEVEALNTYARLGVVDAELGVIPELGRKWKVDKERLEVLLGNNSYKEAFVKKITSDLNNDKEKTLDDNENIAVNANKNNDKDTSTKKGNK